MLMICSLLAAGYLARICCSMFGTCDRFEETIRGEPALPWTGGDMWELSGGVETPFGFAFGLKGGIMLPCIGKPGCGMPFIRGGELWCICGD